MLNMNLIKHLLFLFALCISFLQLSAQNEAQPQRPKVAIALSGGSAKGLAHVGVLKALEKAGLYPDIVTGTSMGSIVGSMYAIGYTPEQIEMIFRNADWGEIFADNVPFEKVNLEEKHDYNKYLMNFFLDEELNPYLPQAAIHGHRIHEMLSNLLWPSVTEKDFTKFPRPFACAATDLLTGQKVIFKSGDLATAVRASMSIPTAFSPIEIDDKLLIDGGVVRNLPVQEAIDLGADIVIAVYTSFDTVVTKEKLKSLDDIIIRTAVFTGVNDTKEQCKLANVLIVPGLSNFSSENYRKNAEIIAAGEKEANKYMHIFKQIADSLDQIAPQKPIRPMGFNQKLYITDVGIKGNTDLTEGYIKYLFDLQTYQYYDSHQIDKSIDKLFNTLLFHRVYYTLEEYDGGYKIWVHVTERPPKEIKLAFNYSDFFGVGILSTITLRNIISNDKLRIPLFISENPILGVEYEKYVSKKKTAMLKIGYQFESNTFTHHDFIDGRLSSSGKYYNLFQNANIGIYKGITKNTFAALKLNRNTSLLLFREGLEDRFGFTSQVHNSLSTEFWLGHVSINKKYFPTKGIYAMVHLNSTIENRSQSNNDTISTIAIEPNYNQINTDIRMYVPIFRKLSCGLLLSAGFSDKTPLFFDHYFIGGNELTMRKHAYNFVGLTPFSITTHNFASSRLQFQYEISNNWHMHIIGNAGVFNDEDFTSMFEPDKIVYAGALSLSYNSIVGPISVCPAYSNLSKSFTWHINIGYPF